MDTERSVGIFNSLIRINNERIEAFEGAFQDTDEPTLKLLFTNLTSNCRKLNDKLIEEVSKLNGVPVEGTSARSKAYKTWRDFTSMFGKKNNISLLVYCKSLEDRVLKLYKKKLAESSGLLSASQAEIIRNQCDHLVKDLDMIDELIEEVTES